MAPGKCRICGASFDTSDAMPTDVCAACAALFNYQVSGKTTSALPVLPGLEVRKALGVGAFGEVYEATDLQFFRPVAAKLARQPAGSDETAARFRQEALVTGNLQHPAIPPVYVLGRDAAGRDFFTMKILEGDTLADILDRCEAGDDETNREYPLSRLLQIFVQICDAIAYAHAQGVIHRDLKPANIMLGRYGEVYVLDWGLARIRGRADGNAQTGAAEGRACRLAQCEDVNRYPTLDGTVMGTVGYMSPEQAEGRLGDIDERSDIYSLGVILHELLTLELPTSGKSNEEILRQTIAGELRPVTASRRGRSAPPELAAIVRKALELRPADRYASVADLGRDVRHFLECREVSVYPERWPRKILKWARRHTALAAALCGTVLLAAAAAIVILALLSRHARQQAASAEIRRAAEERARREVQLRLAAEKEHRASLGRQAEAWREFGCGADLARRIGLEAAAIRHFSAAIAQAPDFLEAYFNRGQMYIRLGHAEKALADLRRADELHRQQYGRGHSQALYLAANLCREYPDMVDGQTAAAYYRQAIEADPESPHAFLAQIYLWAAEGRRVEAISAAREATVKFFFLWESHHTLAVLLAGLDRPDEEERNYLAAEEAISEAIRLNPSEGILYSQRADLRLAMYERNEADAAAIEGARHDLDVAVKLLPHHLGVHVERFKLYLRLDDHRRCAEELEELERLAPGSFYAWSCAAQLRFAERRYEEALQAIADALALLPEEEPRTLAAQIERLAKEGAANSGERLEIIRLLRLKAAAEQKMAEAEGK